MHTINLYLSAFFSLCKVHWPHQPSPISSAGRSFPLFLMLPKNTQLHSLTQCLQENRPYLSPSENQLRPLPCPHGSSRHSPLSEGMAAALSSHLRPQWRL